MSRVIGLILLAFSCLIASLSNVSHVGTTIVNGHSFLWTASTFDLVKSKYWLAPTINRMTIRGCNLVTTLVVLGTDLHKSTREFVSPQGELITYFSWVTWIIPKTSKAHLNFLEHTILDLSKSRKSGQLAVVWVALWSSWIKHGLPVLVYIILLSRDDST